MLKRLNTITYLSPSIRGYDGGTPQGEAAPPTPQTSPVDHAQVGLTGITRHLFRHRLLSPSIVRWGSYNPAGAGLIPDEGKLFYPFSRMSAFGLIQRPYADFTGKDESIIIRRRRRLFIS